MSAVAPGGRRRLKSGQEKQSRAGSQQVVGSEIAPRGGDHEKMDNSVSWLERSGDVCEKAVSNGNADDVVTFIDCFVLGSRA